MDLQVNDKNEERVFLQGPLCLSHMFMTYLYGGFLGVF